MAVEQRDDAWVKAATPEQVAAAYEAGELNELQGIPTNDLGNTASDLRGISK